VPCKIALNIHWQKGNYQALTKTAIGFEIGLLWQNLSRKSGLKERVNRVGALLSTEKPGVKPGLAKINARTWPRLILRY
jgi:hypothetical protein